MTNRVNADARPTIVARFNIVSSAVAYAAFTAPPMAVRMASRRIRALSQMARWHWRALLAPSLSTWIARMLDSMRRRTAGVVEYDARLRRLAQLGNS